MNKLAPFIFNDFKRVLCFESSYDNGIINMQALYANTPVMDAFFVISETSMIVRAKFPKAASMEQRITHKFSAIRIEVIKGRET